MAQALLFFFGPGVNTETQHWQRKYCVSVDDSKQPNVRKPGASRFFKELNFQGWFNEAKFTMLWEDSVSWSSYLSATSNLHKKECTAIAIQSVRTVFKSCLYQFVFQHSFSPSPPLLQSLCRPEIEASVVLNDFLRPSPPIWLGWQGHAISSSPKLRVASVSVLGNQSQALILAQHFHDWAMAPVLFIKTDYIFILRIRDVC